MIMKITVKNLCGKLIISSLTGKNRMLLVVGTKSTVSNSFIKLITLNIYEVKLVALKIAIKYIKELK